MNRLFVKVHPHTRGEHLRPPWMPRSRTGPSPHPWGTRWSSCATGPRSRSIPTPVGNTPCLTIGASAAPVHPHTRGEHSRVASTASTSAGPSPHPWGTLDTVLGLRGLRRSIPTPVGNTPRLPSPHANPPVHPHTRGEHWAGKSPFPPDGGPSPHPWGTRVVGIVRVGQQRSIPTPVGNTGRGWGTTPAGPVHPHTRGEHNSTRENRPCRHGPSPHPWGTRPGHVVHQDPARSIPTPVGNTTAGGATGRPGSVHPHTRGEHRVLMQNGVALSGPSPHPWGTRLGVRPADAARRSIPTPVGNTALKVLLAKSNRSIPTPVGNTSRWCWRPDNRPVHPHTRGEHRHQARGASQMDGPSPHPWGTPVRHAGGRAAGRSIPTPVGNTTPAGRPSRCPSVHPHTRGEHVSTAAQAGDERGPSPHPWGTPTRAVSLTTAPRSIPTPVGNTATSPPARWTPTVHPHTRGEHEALAEQGEDHGGPSPHPWGTPAKVQEGGLGLRSIPTPVGNTESRPVEEGGVAVHPHTRGEHDGQGVRGVEVRGPSPHPWGTPCLRGADRLNERSIPTPVGNTPSSPTSLPVRTVHPHTRGEHSVTTHRKLRFPGPSPHPWGTLHHPRDLGGRLRSIPTPVGNTLSWGSGP